MELVSVGDIQLFEKYVVESNYLLFSAIFFVHNFLATFLVFISWMVL